MSAHPPALSLELDPLIAEAKQRARRRRILLLGCLFAAAATSTAAFGLRSIQRPRPVAPAAPACRSGQLGLTLRDGGVAGGTSGFEFAFENHSETVCTLTGWPTLRVVTRSSRRLATRPHDLIALGYSVKHPPRVPRISLAPRRTVRWILQAADGTGLAHMCPTAKKLLVVPPGGHEAIAVAATVPFCGPRSLWSLPIGRVPH